MKSLSRVQLFATRGLWPTKFLRPWDSPGKNTGVGCHFLSSRPRDQTQVSHIAGRRFNLCTTREALKYKNPSTNIKDFKGGKEARLKEGGGRERWEQKGWPYCCLLPSTDIQALWDFSLGSRERRTGTRPYQKSDQNQNSSSLPRGGDQSPILSSG